MSDGSKSIIIIGAGLAGLSAGIYGRMNGYKTQIFEMHFISGGYSTSWKRKGYTFDSAMDWLNGVNLDSEDSILWKEIGYLQGRKVAYFDDLLRVIERDGKTLTFYANPVQLENELIKLTTYEEDKKKIKKLCSDIDKMSKAPSFDYTKPEALVGGFSKLKMMLKLLPYIRILMEYNSMLVTDYSKQFKDPRLRELMSFFYYDPAMPQAPFTAVYQMMSMNRNLLGYPAGGGGGLSEYMESKYKSLGGEIYYRSKVKKILVRDNKAVGIKLEDGTEYFADTIISACDTRSVIYEMLEGKYVNTVINKLYKEGPIYPSVVRVYLGVDMDFSKEPHTAVYLQNEDMNIPGLYKNHKHNYIMIRHYSKTETSFAPPGKSVVNSVFFADYDYWKELYQDKERYKKEKQNIADIVIDNLEKLYPGIREKIEVIDVTTPVTYERYTNNYRGSLKAWIEDATEVPDLTKKIGMTLPGLENFYMIGQWVVFGGMIRVVASGRYVIENQCKKDKKKFRVLQ